MVEKAYKINFLICIHDRHGSTSRPKGGNTSASKQVMLTLQLKAQVNASPLFSITMQ